MSKRITTRWYIGAWAVWLIAFILAIALRNSAPSGSAPPGLFLLGLVMVVAGVITVVMWIGALIKLGSQRAWGWFAAVLVLHLVGLGILGMVAYAISGPEDIGEVAIRPTTT
jgi:Mn2+/Fe2+ NRAMP family transporter